ncbi:MAG: peroxiredoxin [Nocardioidaceae bacterium]
MNLEMNAPAPDFSLKNQHGETVTLSDFRSHKNVVLVYYPFAFSGVCTGEMCEIRDHVADFSDDQTAILAVSCDPMFTLRAFADKEGLGFPLLSDFWPHGETARAYGIFNEQVGCASRATFVIDREGVLRWRVDNEMPEARNLDDYRKVLADLG